MSTTRDVEAVGYDTAETTRYVGLEMEDSVLVYDREANGGWIQSTISCSLEEVR